MVKLGTFCSYCCFYDTLNKKCGHNIIDTFKERDAEIDFDEYGNHTIDRVCQYKRDENWQTQMPMKDKLELSRQEVYLRGTIIIIANQAENLNKTIDHLNTMKNIENFKLVVLYSEIRFQEVMEIAKSKIKSKYHLVSIKNNDIDLQVYRSLKFSQNGYLFILDSNLDIDENIIDKVNHFVNKKMYRLLHIKPSNKALHQSVSMVGLYKWLKGDLQFDFSEKLNNIAEEEQSDSQVFDWEDINEAYSR